MHDALSQGFPAGCFGYFQAVHSGGIENIDKVSIPSRLPHESFLDLQEGRWKWPLLKRGAIPQCTWFSLQHVKVMPGIINRLVPPKSSLMIRYNHSIPHDLDTAGSGPDGCRITGCSAVDTVMVAVIMDKAGVGNSTLMLRLTTERNPYRNQQSLFVLESLLYSPTFILRMFSPLAERLTLVLKPGIEFGEIAKAWSWSEQPSPDILNLFLNLSFLPAQCRGAGHRFYQAMTAHLRETAIKIPFLAAEYPIDRRGHVVVNTAAAGATKKGESSVMGIKHHLQAFSWIGRYQKLTAVAKPEMSHLDPLGHSGENHILVAPIKLIGVSG